jgi:hypothetical protein
MNTKIEKLPETPWGAAQTSEVIAPGITFYSTASHGGFHLSDERNACVPLRLRQSTFLQLGMKGWYEEDCDASIILAPFPEYAERFRG